MNGKVVPSVPPTRNAPKNCPAGTSPSVPEEGKFANVNHGKHPDSGQAGRRKDPQSNCGRLGLLQDHDCGAHCLLRDWRGSGRDQQWAMLTNPWDNTLPEGAHVYAAIRAAQTGHLYSPYTQSPYVVQSYGPLFYAINAAIAWGSHLDVSQTILLGRLFCFLCYLLCGVFVFAISRRTGATFAVSLLASLMMLGPADFAFWNVSVRPDVPFLLAMLVSLYFAVRNESSDSYSLAISGFFAGLAILIKQPGVAAGIAIFGVLAWNKQYKKAATFVIAAAVPVTVAFALLLWRESSFLGQFTSVGKATWSLRGGIYFLFRRFIANDNALIRVVPFGIGILGLIKAANQKGSRQMLFWFAVTNWVVGLSGLPQLGATTNYFMPGWAGFALLLPAAVEFARERVHFTASVPRFTAAMLTVSALLLWSAWLGYLTCRYTAGFYRAPANVSYAPLRPYRIISDRSVLALYGHDPDLLDNFAVHSLELKNLWSSAPLARRYWTGEIRPDSLATRKL